MKKYKANATDKENEKFKKLKKGQYSKMAADELQQYLLFKKRSFIVPNKKGKGSYKRSKKNFDF